MSKSFQSFVDYDDKLSSPASDELFYQPRELLPGEHGTTSCDGVTFFLQFQEPLVGKITCTDFCFFFQPNKSSPKYARVPRRFSFIDEQFTIPLCSIETIYYTILQTDLAPTSKELKELTAPLSSMETVSYLKIFLKDFRVVTIDMTKTQNAPNIANHLLLFSKPTGTEHLIQAGSDINWITKIEFNDEESWKNELDRCCANSSFTEGGRRRWRICNIKNDLQNVVSSYPWYVVVPYEVTKHELNGMVEHYSGGRFPIWVWSAQNGTVLLRSSTSDDNWLVQDIQKKYYNYVTEKTPSKSHRIIQITEANSTAAVRTAYKRLRKLCSIDSHKLYNAREKDWFTRVHDTGWTHLVYFCLKTAAEILRSMIDRGTSVTITEPDGVDVSAVISSLVQLCADPQNRDTLGIERIINKEWIALGHPFGQRICGVGKSSCCPTFLLFLDCVSQMKRLYPTQFHFSDHYLISLWDLSLTGCVPAFACSSVMEQLALDKKGGPFPLNRFFTKRYRNLFPNILHDAAERLLELSKNSMRTKIQSNPTASLLCDVLRPPTLPVDVELWDLCYLRWIPRANSLVHPDLEGDISYNEGEVTSEIELDKIMERLSRSSGYYWSITRSTSETTLNTLGPSYPYSLPQTKPYITESLDQVDSISVNSVSAFQLNLKEGKSKSRSNSLTIQQPIAAPRRALRNAPPPPPRKNSDSVYKTHF